jgi:hypothetical protein
VIKISRSVKFSEVFPLEPDKLALILVILAFFTPKEVTTAHKLPRFDSDERSVCWCVFFLQIVQPLLVDSTTLLGIDRIGNASL